MVEAKDRLGISRHLATFGNGDDSVSGLLDVVVDQWVIAYDLMASERVAESEVESRCIHKPHIVRIDMSRRIDVPTENQCAGTAP
jgi:hypothetical protein